MRTHLIMVAAILAASSTVALIANTTWYDMEWIRREIGNTGKQPGPTTPPNGDNLIVEPPDPTEPEEGYILIDGVLENLAAQSAFFVDAREQDDYDEGHLRGAIFVPADDIYEHVPNGLMATGALGRDLIIVYCGSPTCDASHNVADALRRDFSFENVLIYKNGWEEIEASDRFEDYIVEGDES